MDYRRSFPRASESFHRPPHLFSSGKLPLPAVSQINVIKRGLWKNKLIHAFLIENRLAWLILTDVFIVDRFLIQWVNIGSPAAFNSRLYSSLGKIKRPHYTKQSNILLEILVCFEIYEYQSTLEQVISHSLLESEEIGSIFINFILRKPCLWEKALFF